MCVRARATPTCSLSPTRDTFQRYGNDERRGWDEGVALARVELLADVWHAWWRARWCHDDDAEYAAAAAAADDDDDNDDHFLFLMQRECILTRDAGGE